MNKNTGTLLRVVIFAMANLDMSSSKKYFKIIGVSAHLHFGAKGHWESFHRSLYNALRSHPRIDKPIYLGLRNQQRSEKNWYEEEVPWRLTQRFKWLDIRFFKTLLNLAKGKDTSTTRVFLVFEGNLFAILLYSALLRCRPNAVAIVNIFQCEKYVNQLQSILGRVSFKFICHIALSGLNSRLILTAETTRFANKIDEVIGLKVRVFPVFSGIEPHERAPVNSRKLMISIRGAEASLKLLESCRSIGADNLPELLVHGLESEDLIKEFSKFNSVKLSVGHIQEVEYQNLYKNYSTAFFMYDPKLFSFQSSGRLCDAIVTGKEIIVPHNTALSEIAGMYGNTFEYDFASNLSIQKVLLGEYVISKKQYSPLPTAKNAVETLISIIEPQGENQPKRLGSFIFWAYVIPAWLISGVFHIVSAIKYKIMNGHM